MSEAKHTKKGMFIRGSAPSGRRVWILPPSKPVDPIDVLAEANRLGMSTSVKPRTTGAEFILLNFLFYIFFKRKSPLELWKNCSFNIFVEVSPHGTRERLWQS